jgi:branched-chain amino acid transport system substrate-binding protein
VGDVQIGALLSLSGSGAEIGREVQAVLQESLECFNQYAASLGSNLKISLLVEDTGSNPETAVLAAKKLINRGVHSFIGPLTSAELAAVAPLLDSQGLLTISPTSTAPSLNKKDHTYRLIMNDTHQSQALAALLQKDQINNVVVLYRNDLYGQDLISAFRDVYPGTVQAIAYDAGAGDFEALLRQAALLAAQTEKDHTAVLAISYDEITSLMKIPDGSLLNDIRWYGTDSTAKVRFTALGYSAYGNYFDALYPVVNYRLAQKISHQLQESSLPAFDALWILGCAYLENGNVDYEMIEKYVQNVRFRGLSGIVTMDGNGDRSIGYYRIYRLDDEAGNYRWLNTGLYSLDYAKKGIIDMVR